MKNGSDDGNKNPVYGIYFWWGGIVVLTQGLLILLKRLFYVFYSEKNPAIWLTVIVSLRLWLPFAAVLAVFAVLAVYRIGKFRFNPAGKGAADIWCLCIAISLAYTDFIPTAASLSAPNYGAAMPWFLSKQSSLYQISTSSNSVIAFLILSAALLSAGAVFKMRRFQIAGTLLAAAGIVLACFYPRCPARGSEAEFFGSLLGLAGGIAEPVCLLWTGFLLKCGRLRNEEVPDPGTTEAPGRFSGRDGIVSKTPSGNGTENPGRLFDCWKRPSSHTGTGNPENAKQRWP